MSANNRIAYTRSVICTALLAMLTDISAETPPNFYTYVEPLPRWSADIKKGSIEPNLLYWPNYYGEKYASHYGISLGYKLIRQIEVGAELGYIEDEGIGIRPLNNSIGGTVKYEQFPTSLYVLLRGVFTEGQWVVPYVGGGFTRAYYRQSADNQQSARGDYDGSHSRYGLQILLDGIDSGGAAAMQTDHLVENTYFTIEVQKLKIKTDQDIDLGGESIMYGLMIEF